MHLTWRQRSPTTEESIGWARFRRDEFDEEAYAIEIIMVDDGCNQDIETSEHQIQDIMDGNMALHACRIGDGAECNE